MFLGIKKVNFPQFVGLHAFLDFSLKVNFIKIPEDCVLLRFVRYIVLFYPCLDHGLSILLFGLGACDETVPELLTLLPENSLHCVKLTK